MANYFKIEFIILNNERKNIKCYQQIVKVLSDSSILLAKTATLISLVGINLLFRYYKWTKLCLAVALAQKRCPDDAGTYWSMSDATFSKIKHNFCYSTNNNSDNSTFSRIYSNYKHPIDRLLNYSRYYRFYIL